MRYTLQLIRDMTERAYWTIDLHTLCTQPRREAEDNTARRDTECYIVTLQRFTSYSTTTNYNQHTVADASTARLFVSLVESNHQSHHNNPISCVVKLPVYVHSNILIRVTHSLFHYQGPHFFHSRIYPFQCSLPSSLMRNSRITDQPFTLICPIRTLG